MDYRALLKKYINHVGDCEGTTFIDNCSTEDYGGVVFTSEEIAELESLDAEALKENKS